MERQRTIPRTSLALTSTHGFRSERINYLKIIWINESCNGELIRKPCKETNGNTLKSCFTSNSKHFRPNDLMCKQSPKITHIEIHIVSTHRNFLIYSQFYFLHCWTSILIRLKFRLTKTCHLNASAHARSSHPLNLWFSSFQVNEWLLRIEFINKINPIKQHYSYMANV